MASTLSVVIPVYNEEKTITKTVKLVIEAHSYHLTKQIIIINDGSTDRTAQKLLAVKKLYGHKIKLLKHATNQGKGSSIQTGLKEASGEILLIQDADLEYSPIYYPKLLKPIIKNQQEVVYGSRFLDSKLILIGQNKTRFPLHYLANKLLSWLTSTIYGQKITDMETGYKVMSKRVYQNLEIKNTGFDCEPEITIRILKAGYKIKEVPISTTPRLYREGKKIKWTDFFPTVLTIFRLKYDQGKKI